MGHPLVEQQQQTTLSRCRRLRVQHQHEQRAKPLPSVESRVLAFAEPIRGPGVDVAHLTFGIRYQPIVLRFNQEAALMAPLVGQLHGLRSCLRKSPESARCIDAYSRLTAQLHAYVDRYQ